MDGLLSRPFHFGDEIADGEAQKGKDQPFRQSEFQPDLQPVQRTHHSINMWAYRAPVVSYETHIGEDRPDKSDYETDPTYTLS